MLFSDTSSGSVVIYHKIKRQGSHDVHGSVHRNINLIEITNKMQTCIKIYYSNVS
jgi:hypothetical protein